MQIFKQLKELYGPITNYFNGNQSVEDWELLSEAQKEKIMKGLQQAKAGLGTPAKDVIKNAGEKYGLNG
jgi:hypothetical protein